MDKDAAIFVTGWETTLMGRAITRQLQRRGYQKILGFPTNDLALDFPAVSRFFRTERPRYVFVAGVRSAGILANVSQPADLMAANLLADMNVMVAAQAWGVRGLIYLASSCVYPRNCPQPMATTHLMTGPFEPTSRAYAMAKLAGIEFVRANRRQHAANFLAVIPADVFGPGDSFRAGDAHVVPALIRRFHEARAAGLPTVEVWGSGQPRRELMLADDAADACVFLMEQEAWSARELLNVGCGEDITIAEAAELIKEVVGYAGAITFDASKPDGAPRKLLDSTELRSLGWQPRTKLGDAIAETYHWYLENGGSHE